MRVRKATGLLLLFLSVAAFACRRGATRASDDGGPARLRIAVVPKGTTHEFWKSVHAGAVKAARELDVDVVWKGALREDDLKGQIDVVQSFIAQGVSGIVLAPLSDKGLVSAVKTATGAHVPVVVFDSDLASEDYVSFVATDNEAAGRMAAEALAARLAGSGQGRTWSCSATRRAPRAPACARRASSRPCAPIRKSGS